jgi:hydroxymethylbilane synthase
LYNKVHKTAQQITQEYMKIPDGSFEKKTIFVSRNLSTISPILVHLNSLECEVFHESLVKFSQVRFTHTPPTQWIFFTSKPSIHHFFSQNPELKPQVKYAVMNEVSAEYLTLYDKKADFVGNSIDAIQIAKVFSNLAKNETVLFPQAIDSLHAVQKQLSFTNTCYNLSVYKNILKTDFNLSFADILVFTSPSNVQAYFEKYKLMEGQDIVATDSITFEKLKFYGIKDISMPVSFEDSALLDIILLRLGKKPQQKIHKRSDNSNP